MNLRAWQNRHSFTYSTAAEALGMERTTFYRYLNRPADKLPRWLLLACWAIDRGANV